MWLPRAAGSLAHPPRPAPAQRHLPLPTPTPRSHPAPVEGLSGCRQAGGGGGGRLSQPQPHDLAAAWKAPTARTRRALGASPGQVIAPGRGPSAAEHEPPPPPLSRCPQGAGLGAQPAKGVQSCAGLPSSSTGGLGWGGFPRPMLRIRGDLSGRGATGSGLLLPGRWQKCTLRILRGPFIRSCLNSRRGTLRFQASPISTPLRPGVRPAILVPLLTLSNERTQAESQRRSQGRSPPRLPASGPAWPAQITLEASSRV